MHCKWNSTEYENSGSMPVNVYVNDLKDKKINGFTET